MNVGSLKRLRLMSRVTPSRSSSTNVQIQLVSWERQQSTWWGSTRASRILFEPDKGPPDGLNKGFAGTSAGILGYLNSDDRFAPGALDYVLRYFERRPEVDVLCGAIRIIDETGRGRGAASGQRRAPLRL